MTYRRPCFESRLVDLVLGILLIVYICVGTRVFKRIGASVYPCASFKATLGFDSIGAVYLTVVDLWSKLTTYGSA